MQARIGPIVATKITSSLSSNLSASGTIVSETVSSNSIGFGAILSYNSSMELEEADINSPSAVPGLFLALETGTGSVDVLCWNGGFVRNDSWSLIPGQPIYLDSSTPGLFSYTGSSGEAIGYTKSSNTIWFGPIPFFFEQSIITFTHTGSSFSPRIDVEDGATILWTFADDSTSDSDSPTVDFGSSATRETTLKVTPWTALTGINVGYDAEDGGTLGVNFGVVGKSYALAQQNVTAITGIGNAAGSLEVLACSYNPIDYLYFDGCSALQAVECYQCTSLDSVTLTGASSLRRFCIEGCSVETLNISDCSLIEDLRGAGQEGGLDTVTFGNVGEHLWHICMHGNSFSTNLPDVSRFVSVQDFYMWSSNQSGSLTFAGGHLRDLIINDNNYTSLDVSCGFGYDGSINISNNNLTSIDVSNCSLLTLINAENNSLSQTQVDTLLATMDAYNTEGRSINLLGNAAPSSTGLEHVASLQSRSWTISVESDAPYVSTYSPNVAANNVEVDTVFTITFSEIVNAQTGGTISVYDSEDSLVQELSVTSDITGSGTNEISFSLSSSLSNETGYYVLISNGAFADVDSNLYAGITSSSTWYFTTISATTLFSDDFNRADGSPGNGWEVLNATCEIDTSRLLITHSGYGIVYNAISESLPADYIFRIQVPHSTLSTAFWGIATRTIYDSGVPEVTGTRLLFEDATTITVGDCRAFNSNPGTITVTNGVPTSWSEDRVHSVGLGSVGNRHYILLDEQDIGTEYGYYDYTINNQSGTGIGIIGEGLNRTWDNAVVTPAS